MQDSDPVKTAYAELERLECGRYAFELLTIRYMATRILMMLNLGGGVELDDQLIARVKKATEHANRATAEKKLAELEATIFVHDLHTIESMVFQIREQFAAGGQEITPQLDDRIKKAAVGAHVIAATNKLIAFEAADDVLEPSIISRRASDIQKQFIAGEVEIDESRKTRFYFAIKRANRLAAEEKLARLETLGRPTVLPEYPVTAETIQSIKTHIRHQFALGGVQLTAQRELPEDLEKRLTAAAKTAAIAFEHLHIGEAMMREGDRLRRLQMRESRHDGLGVRAGLEKQHFLNSTEPGSTIGLL